MTSPAAVQPAQRQIARAAGTVMLAFVLSNLVGLLRDVLVYRTFGTQAGLDTFYAANRVAETLYNLAAGGALGSAFIPTFTALLTRGERTDAWRLASAIANLVLLVLTALAALAAVFAPQVVRYGLFLLEPGGNPVQESLAVELLRILLPTVVVFGLSGLLMGVLNAHQIFWAPAIAPAMYSFGWILGMWLLPESMGVYRLAYGALGGSLLHLLIQLPWLLRLNGRYWPSLGLRMPAVRQVARLMGPRLFGVAVVQLNFFVNTIIGLNLAAGSVAAITAAFRLMLMPQMAIAQSVAVAAMPTFSAQAAQERLDEMRSALAGTLRAVLVLALPASAGLIMLRRPLMVLYSSTAFDERSIQLVTWALLWYGLGLVGHSVVEIVSRAFYALQDTRTPVTVGVAAMTLNVLYSLGFTSLFRSMGWMPHGGLALANSLATFLEMLALLALMSLRLKGLEGREMLRTLGKSGAATAAMAAVLAGWLALVGNDPGWLALLGGLAAGVLAYGAALLALRASELELILGWTRRLAGRFHRG